MERTGNQLKNQSHKKQRSFDISSEDLALAVQDFFDAGGKITFINKSRKKSDDVGDKKPEERL